MCNGAAMVPMFFEIVCFLFPAKSCVLAKTCNYYYNVTSVMCSYYCVVTVVQYVDIRQDRALLLNRYSMYWILHTTINRLITNLSLHEMGISKYFITRTVEEGKVKFKKLLSLRGFRVSDRE